MLKDDQRGSIIGIIIAVVAILVVFSVLRNMYSRNDSGGTADTQGTVIDEAEDAASDVQDTGKGARNILNGLTGN